MHRLQQIRQLPTQLRDIGRRHLRTAIALATVTACYFVQDSSLTAFYHAART